MSASSTPESELLTFRVSIWGPFTGFSACQVPYQGTDGSGGSRGAELVRGCGERAVCAVAEPWPALPWLDRGAAGGAAWFFGLAFVGVTDGETWPGAELGAVS